MTTTDKTGSLTDYDDWMRRLRDLMTERQRADLDAGEWVECDTCTAKPGSPQLCAGCLANRARWNRVDDAAVDKLVNKICMRFCEAHDGQELWGHSRRDPDLFRLAIKIDLLPFLRGKR